jgi:hypothetical protein
MVVMIAADTISSYLMAEFLDEGILASSIV